MNETIGRAQMVSVTIWHAGGVGVVIIEHGCGTG